MNRRSFLKGSGLAAASCALRGAHAQQATDARSFTFAFFTDVHIESALDAPQGTQLAFDLINASDAEFAICGGDHIYDALSAERESIVDQYALYVQTEKTLNIPVYHVL